MKFGWLFCCVSAWYIVVGCGDSQDKKQNPERDVFGDNVRTTEFQTPEQEKAGFVLPEGFEATLFASEPDISKPMNMEFDDRGRLWVTQSSEYPLPANPGGGKDRISILEDTNGDGKADKFIHFKDDVNIPIGILPINNGAIVYSIPNVTKYIDTNNDDKADIVFANLAGKEFSVAKTDMAEYKPSSYTLMPDQFRNSIPEGDYYSLLEFLLSQK